MIRLMGPTLGEEGTEERAPPEPGAEAFRQILHFSLKNRIVRHNAGYSVKLECQVNNKNVSV